MVDTYLNIFEDGSHTFPTFGLLLIKRLLRFICGSLTWSLRTVLRIYDIPSNQNLHREAQQE